MSIEDRLTMNRRIAEGYRDAYKRMGVQDGEKYDSWAFAPGAEYVSPYWTNDEVIILSEQDTEAGKSAIMEAKSISLVYDDWAPVDCQIWPSDDGFVMKNKWTAVRKRDAQPVRYYSYTFARTNEQGQITRWETHVDEDFGPFIEEVIGIRGPFEGDTYMKALATALERAGVSI
jgi:hypothetical protein